MLLPTGASTDFTSTTLDTSLWPPVVEGTLSYDDGSRADEVSKGERLVAVLGLGATARGVADVIAGLVNSSTGGTATSSMTVDDLAKALLVYNGDYTASAGAERWQVGLRLPLPLEVSNVSSELVSDRTSLDAWAAAYTPAFVVPDTAVLELPILAPETVQSTAQATIAAAGTDFASVGEGLAAAMAENPFDVVFTAIEIFGQVASNPAHEFAVAQGLAAALSDWQAKQLGALTAGNAIFRRVWRALRTTPSGATADAAAKARVADALGLATLAGARVDPAHFTITEQESGAHPATGPSVVPVELRLTAKQRQRGKLDRSAKARSGRTGEPTGGQHVVVLGRDLCVGERTAVGYGSFTATAGAARTKLSSTWAGPAYEGRIDPNAFEAQHRSLVTPAGLPKFGEGLKVALAISPNEGKLDAGRAADAGILSTGMQQWSLHTNREMPPLLHRFRGLAPDHFDLFFGLYGLQTALSAPAASGGEQASPAAADVQKANPDAGATTPVGDDYPTYVTLAQVLPNVDADDPAGRLPEPVTFPPELDNPRLAYFSGTVKGHDVEFGGEWSARVRLAGRCSVPYGVNELQVSVARFRRIARDVKDETVGGPGPAIPVLTATVAQLFTSQFAAGALLDQHINKPSAVQAAVTQAIKRTQGQPLDVDPVTNAATLRADWLIRFAVNYVGVRDTFDKPVRDDTLIKAHDNGLNPDPGTFQGW